MRICYYADGRYIHALRWMKFFAEKGHEMHLISFAPVDDPQIEVLKRAGIKYHGHTGNFHVKKFWLSLRDLVFVRSILKREKIDILHSHFLGTNIWFGALSGFHPHLITAMGGDVTGIDWKPSCNLQEKLLTPFALRNADMVTAWGPVLASRIQPYMRQGTNIEITHGGVDLNTFTAGSKPIALRERLNIPEDGRIVFSPRLIRRLYNIDMIARAAGIVSERLPNTFFVIALPSQILDTEYVAEIKEIVANGAARDTVRFVPTIPHDEIADYFRLADVSVSIPDTDGLGLSILESMACGTPTVIGDLPDYDCEYYENDKTTIMAEVKNPKSIADGILKILNNEVLARNISNEARRRVEATGGYEFQMTKMENIYRSLNTD